MIKINTGDSKITLVKDLMKGDPGASAYEIALAHGFEGTEEEWLLSLEGEDGEPGADGKDGESGVYVGSTAPEDNSLIWIDPAGEPSDVVTMAAVEAKGYQTEAQVQALINAAITEVENGTY